MDNKTMPKGQMQDEHSKGSKMNESMQNQHNQQGTQKQGSNMHEKQQSNRDMK